MTIAELIDKLHEAAKYLKDGEKTKLGAITAYSHSIGSISLHPITHDININAKMDRFGFGNIQLIEKWERPEK